MTATKARLAGIALVGIGLAIAWAPVNHWLDVDSCLDRGGSYDYAKRVCDFEGAHPLPDSERAPDRRLRAGGLFVLLGIAVVLCARSIERWTK